MRTSAVSSLLAFLLPGAFWLGLSAQLISCDEPQAATKVPLVPLVSLLLEPCSEKKGWEHRPPGLTKGESSCPLKGCMKLLWTHPSRLPASAGAEIRADVAAAY